MKSSVVGTLLLSVPALSLLTIEALGFHIKLFLLICLLLGAMLFRFRNKQVTNIFAGSGQSNPAVCSQEFLLQRRGGQGNDYFLDPSAGFSSIHDFDYVPGKHITFRHLLKAKSRVLSLYCIDDENRQIVLVETPAGFDPSEHGSYFQAQRKHAIKLYTVPYDEYHAVVRTLNKEMVSTSNVLFNYNTSRCGNAFSKYLNPRMQSISEPDIFTSLSNIASESYGTRNAELIALARSSVQLLCYLHRHRHPERKDICIKFRPQVVYIADLIQKAIPDAKSIFVYRRALDVIDSKCVEFIKDNSFYWLIRFLRLDVFYLYYFSNLTDHLYKVMPLIKDTRRFPLSSYREFGFISFFIMSWLSVMHKAMEALESGNISVSVEWQELVFHQEALVCKILKSINFPSPVDDMVIHKRTGSLNRYRNQCTLYRQRSQCRYAKRTYYADKKVRDGYIFLNEIEVFEIKAFMTRHEIGIPDFVIPRTLTIH